MSLALLDPTLLAWRARVDEVAVEIGPPDDLRKWAGTLGDRLAAQYAIPPSGAVRVEEHRLNAMNGLRVRSYTPPSSTRSLGVYLHVHGGGFIFGSIDDLQSRSICSWRALDANLVVLDVEYSLAPEVRFPRPVEEVLGVLKWIASNEDSLGVDATRIVLGGGSAGASISLSAALAARDIAVPRLAGLLLEVPCVDMRDVALNKMENLELNWLTEFRNMRDSYLGDADPSNELASPLLIKSVAGLPNTHVMTAEFDPFAPAAEEFAARCRTGGATVSGTRHLGQLHASSNLTLEYWPARLWQQEVVAFLRARTTTGQR